LEEYQKVRLIGRGRFSEVFLARHRGTGEMVAVKKVIVSDPDASKHLFDEARLLRKLPRHPNIVHCRSIACYRNDLFMVLEVAERGDLDRLIREKRDAGVSPGRALSCVAAAERVANAQLPFREEEIWRIFKQIAMALQHMHRYKVLHRDLKPSNVFLMESGDVKLGDLGLGREIGSYSKQVFSVVGTQRYMPPELVLGTGYTVASEIWGLGCVLYEMATLQPAFPTTNLAQLSAAIREARFDTQALAAGNSQALISLVTGMLQARTALAITALARVHELTAALFLPAAQPRGAPHDRPSGRSCFACARGGRGSSCESRSRRAPRPSAAAARAGPRRSRCASALGGARFSRCARRWAAARPASPIVRCAPLCPPPPPPPRPPPRPPPPPIPAHMHMLLYIFRSWHCDLLRSRALASSAHTQR
jgi:NIMA (never in mitosis gene a)-related kinase